MKKFLFLVALGVAITAMTISCKSKPKLLTEAQVAAKVDSLYQVQAESLGLDLDDACDAKFDDLVQTAVDSIIEARNTVQ